MRISDWSSDVCSSDLRLPKMTMLALLQLSWPRAAMLCLPLLPGGTKRYSMAVWRADQQMKGPSCCANRNPAAFVRSEEHTSELQSLMRISYAVFCLKKKKKTEKSQAETTDIHD